MIKWDPILAGSAVTVSWVSSGQTSVTSSAPLFTLRDSSEVVVDSGFMTSSGNGHFYRSVQLPSTDGYYVGETSALIGGVSYKNIRGMKLFSSLVD